MPEQGRFFEVTDNERPTMHFGEAARQYRAQRADVSDETLAALAFYGADADQDLTLTLWQAGQEVETDEHVSASAHDLSDPFITDVPTDDSSSEAVDKLRDPYLFGGIVGKPRAQF